jgi:Ca2+-binding EF-hand superfamily protein
LHLPQAKLPQPLLEVIEEWFSLVDEDGSGSLTAEELENAFAVSTVSLT